MTMTHQQDLKGVFTAKDLDFKPAGKITKKDLNTGVTKAEYAVRGAIPTRADELKEELKKTQKFCLSMILSMRTLVIRSNWIRSL